jgi:hypothetical protein
LVGVAAWAARADRLTGDVRGGVGGSVSATARGRRLRAGASSGTATLGVLLDAVGPLDGVALALLRVTRFGDETEPWDAVRLREAWAG